MFNLTPVVKNLIILNVGIFVLQLLFNEKVFQPGYGYYETDVISRHLSLFDPQSSYFKPYQLLSHMFLHSGFRHIIFNMIALIVFGPMVERMLGDKKFLVFYIVCGFGAAITFMLFQYFVTGAIPPMVGASGAIFGVLIAGAMYFPNTEMIIFPIPIPVKLKYLALGYMGYQIFKTYSSFVNPHNNDHVAYVAHIGGGLIGFILIKIWQKWPSNNW